MFFRGDFQWHSDLNFSLLSLVEADLRESILLVYLRTREWARVWRTVTGAFQWTFILEFLI